MMNNNNNLYKTALCRNFEQTGQCNYGDNCRFAHGEQELRPKPQFEQRQFGGGNRGQFGAPGFGGGNFNGGPRGPPGICRNFQQMGNCNYGDNCRFAHQLPGM